MDTGVAAVMLAVSTGAAVDAVLRDLHAGFSTS
jgi:hypothetical protein